MDINAIISDTLTDGTHVWIILKGIYIYIKISLKYIRGFGGAWFGGS